MEINRNGQKVTINVADFDADTMIKWVDPMGTKGAEDGAFRIPPPAPVLKFHGKVKGD